MTYNIHALIIHMECQSSACALKRMAGALVGVVRSPPAAKSNDRPLSHFRDRPHPGHLAPITSLSAHPSVRPPTQSSAKRDPGQARAGANRAEQNRSRMQKRQAGRRKGDAEAQKKGQAVGRYLLTCSRLGGRCINWPEWSVVVVSRRRRRQ